MFSDPGLRAGVSFRDARFWYTVETQPYLNRDVTIWEGSIDRVTGAVEGKSRIRDWPGAVELTELTASDDGTRVAYLKSSPQKDVYIADLNADGEPVNPRRLTLDDNNDFATNWTPDSRSVFFSSDRPARSTSSARTSIGERRTRSYRVPTTKRVPPRSALMAHGFTFSCHRRVGG